MRISTSKSENSESFYITQSYVKENGKTSSKIYKKLGTLKELSKKLNTDREGVMKWAKEQARIETEKYNNECNTILIPLHPNRLIQNGQAAPLNCGYLFLQSICKELKLDNICRNIKSRHNYEFNLLSILSDMIYCRILHPSSKLSSYKFAQKLLEKPKYELHDVYRSLSVLASECDYIQAELYRNSNFVHPRNKSVYYYDCTNYYFEINQEDNLKKYGKSKQHRPNPIVGMGLFMDADGIPLAFNIYPGNQNEQKTLKPLEQKIIRDFDCSEFIFCSDSGLGSQDNKLFNDIQGRSYVITQSLKKLKADYRDNALDPKNFRKLGSPKFVNLKNLDESDPEVFNSIYYKEIPIESKKISETMIVTYSPKYAAYHRKIREKQIERAQKMIEKGNKIKKQTKNPNDPARFIKKYATTKNGEVADQEVFTLNEEKIEDEAMYDGFYAVTTDIDGDVAELIAINRRRWQIEECFRIMKTEFEARPVYLQREDRIKAHFLTCFIALLVYRLLEIKLENEFTVSEILETLRGMNLRLFQDSGYVPVYERNDITDKLHNVFGFRTDYEIIRKSKMRNIIKNTKK